MTQIFLHTLLMAMVPVVELRGAIPLGLAQGLSPWLTYLAAVIGNMMPVPFIMVFIRRVLNWLREVSPWLREKVDWLIRRAEKKSDLVRRYALVGLVILVAVPLPGTGAWTGSLVAALMDIRLRHSFPAVFIGVLIAGVVVLAICGGLSILLSKEKR